MAIDLAKIQNRLAGLKTTNEKGKHIWKPVKGKSIVRIIPYKHQADNPFVELLFHYGVNNKTYLSPSTFNRPDPIVEMSNKLKRGDTDAWKEGKKLEPKMRVYVPVIVRDHEDEGVRFWGMGKQVYQDILSIIADPDYGDITDLSNGRDLVVEFVPAAGPGKFPTTTVRARPVITKAFDPTNTELRTKVQNQINILELYPEPTYDELVKAMDEWMNTPENGDAVPASDDEAETTPVTKTESATVAAAKKPATDAKQVADEFDQLFNVKG